MALIGQPAAAVVTPTLRVATFNIHRGRDVHGQFDLARTAGCLTGFQVVGLNEVGGAYSWQEGDQAELLGKQLHAPWLFAPTTRRWWRDDFGNGLLCSAPVDSWRREPLPCTRGKGYRNYVLANLQWGHRTVSLLVTHLDRVQDRAMQLSDVIKVFLALPEPAILMGDLNSEADDPQIARLLSTPGVHDAVAEGLAGEAPRRIDWIFARGLSGVAAGIVDTGASDHPLVWTELAPLAEPEAAERQSAY